ncbi:MAG: hypothetical protein HY696_09350 [Deltaproteobacteria bacterium]|nr:hypothetical protein [Deltaproteobacteria bacterium]
MRAARTRGQVAILALLLLPLLIVLLVVLADVALTVVTKVRLQVVADRAALAAADSLATTLNQLGQQNWRIHREFVEHERHVQQHQHKDEAEAKSQFAARQATIDAIRGEMDTAVADGYTRACDAALAVVEAQAPWAELLPLVGGTRVVPTSEGRRCIADEPLFDFGGDQVRADQWPELTASYTDGGDGFEDPARVQEVTERLLSYRLKPPGEGQQVAFAVRLRSRPPLSYFPDTFDDSDLWLQGSAAAQPYGGSVERTAFLETDDEAEARASAEDAGWTYEATLMPLATLQQPALGYRGLRYFDEVEGWTDDVETYLH